MVTTTRCQVSVPHHATTLKPPCIRPIPKLWKLQPRICFRWNMISMFTRGCKQNVFCSHDKRRDNITASATLVATASYGFSYSPQSPGIHLCVHACNQNWTVSNLWPGGHADLCSAWQVKPLWPCWIRLLKDKGGSCSQWGVVLLPDSCS